MTTVSTAAPARERDAALYIDIIERLRRGEHRAGAPQGAPGETDPVLRALNALARDLELRDTELRRVDRITASVSAGFMLEDVMEGIYRDFKELIPYDRIGIALLEDAGRVLRAVWARSDLPVANLLAGYAAPMAGSSLETILATGEPRILNDLEEYLRGKPQSHSTRLIVSEGICSSLTCPLVANGTPVGFLFFSSALPNAYAGAHVETYKRIARRLSILIEKGRLVSELAQQKSAIERQNEELRRLNELKNRFIGMAAHDLRSPIAAIQMVGDLLLAPETELGAQEREAFLRDVAEQSRHMLALLDDLLDVAQIEAGQLLLHLQRVDLAAFLQDAVGRHGRLAASKGTRVLLEGAPSGYVQADSLRLRQVIDNLISNAVKYSPAGSVVRLRAARMPSGWRVCVQDEGPGINAEDRKRLFQDFARLSARPTGGEKSIGLGLAITRRVIEAHGGQIGVDSEPGHGATFWFILPDAAEGPRPAAT